MIIIMKKGVHVWFSVIGYVIMVFLTLRGTASHHNLHNMNGYENSYGEDNSHTIDYNSGPVRYNNGYNDHNDDHNTNGEHDNTDMMVGHQKNHRNNGHHRHDHHNARQHYAGPTRTISCYKCNSEFDPRCGDPFDPYSIGIVNCSMRPPPPHFTDPEDMEPKLCRKTVQKVYGKFRIIRDCGYLTSDRDDKQCVKRSGTHDVFAFYCSCTKSLCNTASVPVLPARLALLTTGLTLLLTLRSNA